MVPDARACPGARGFLSSWILVCDERECGCNRATSAVYGKNGAGEAAAPTCCVSVLVRASFLFSTCVVNFRRRILLSGRFLLWPNSVRSRFRLTGLTAERRRGFLVRCIRPSLLPR